MKFKRLVLPSLAGAIVVIGLAVASLLKTRRAMRAESDAITASPAGFRPDGPVRDLSTMMAPWKAPSFDYVDQDGRHITNRDLLGHPWIADFIYTQCTTACPVLTARMRLLQRRITNPEVRFVSFSVDPAHDTPSVLKAYATKWHGDESRWRLLSMGHDANVHATATGMRVAVEHSSDPTNPILHTSRFILVDAAGLVRGLYDSSDEQDLKQLEADLKSLTHSAVKPLQASVSSPMLMHEDLAKAGKALFESIGCAGCHAQERIAPTLAGVAGSVVMLDNNRTVRADDAYLRESITDPQAKIVNGYLPTMPSYRGHITDSDVASLIAYLHSISPSPASMATSQPVQLVTDPVCKMKVRAESSAPHVEINGKVYYFCSDGCRDRFARNPALFLDHEKH